MARNTGAFSLPVTVASPIDLNRLIREAETAIEQIKQAGLRKPGEETRLPRLSRLLTEMLETNNLNMLHETDQKQLIEIFAHLKKHAPTIHMSFSADPSPAFMQKLISWLRREIHPYILVRTGLQPMIGAGCVLRTTNRFYDFSLRQHLDKQKQLLVQSLRQQDGSQA